MKLILSVDGLGFNDLRLDLMPNLKGLLNSSYVIKKMDTVFPSVTWAIHTTAVTGKLPEEHSVVGNYFANESFENIPYWSSTVKKEDIIQTATFYDLFKKKGEKIASVCWPLTQGAANIDWNIPEFYNQDDFEQYCTPGLYHELAEKGFPVKNYGKWSTVNDSVILQDELSWQIMKYLIRVKKPDLLMGHFLTIDTMEHVYGCNSPEVFFGMKFIDDQVGKILKLLKDENLFDSCQLIIFSDHGQTNITEEWNLEEDLKVNGLDKKISVIDEGGCLYFYIHDFNPKCVEKIEAFLAQNKHIASFTNNKCGVIRKADYMVALKPGCTTTSYAAKHKATHGFDPQICNEMNPFVVFGAESEYSKRDKLFITDIYNLMIEMEEKGNV